MPNKVSGIAEITRKKKGDLIEIRFQNQSAFMRMLSDFILRTSDKCEAAVTFKRSAVPKTNEQLGYYFGVICKYVAAGFQQRGYSYMDYHKADYELRMMFHYEEFESPAGLRRYPASLGEGTGIDEVSELIDKSIQWCIEEFEITPPEPDKNYKSKRR